MELTGTAEECMKQANDAMAKPNVTADLGIELVKRIYGLQVTEIKSLNSFFDKNFHIKVSKDHQNPNIDQISDDGYTLKVMNTFKSNLKGHFDAIHEAMILLHGKGFRVPQPIRNLEGKTWAMETLPLQESEGELAKTLQCGVHLLTYIPGEPLATIESDQQIFFQWGELLAKFHNCLKDFDSPALEKQWTFVNAKNYHLVKGILDSMPEGAMDPEARTLVEEVVERFSSEYEKYATDLPKGFLHGDFNDQNILVHASSETSSGYCVQGILDFDDMNHGSYAWDLGTMLGHALLVKKTLDPLEAVGHAVAGYQSVRKLSKKELMFLKTAMECRVGLMCFASTVVDKDPSNSYIQMLAPVKPKIDILKKLSQVDNERFLKIYDYYTNFYLEFK